MIKQRNELSGKQDRIDFTIKKEERGKKKEANRK